MFIDINKEAALRLKPTPTPGSTNSPATRKPTARKPTARPTTSPTARPTTKPAQPRTNNPTRRASTLPATCSSGSSETSNSWTHGRLSRGDFNKIINKKDLFQICAAASGGLVAEGASVGIALPGEIGDVANKFIPKLVIDRIDAIVKKEVNIGSTAVKPGRKMYEADRRRLEGSITTDSHRALRMLCGKDVLPNGFNPDCQEQKNGYACAKLSNIDIDMGELKNMIDKVIGKLVVPDYKSQGLSPGYFDEIGSKLLILDDRLPGISDLAQRR